VYYSRGTLLCTMASPDSSPASHPREQVRSEPFPNVVVAARALACAFDAPVTAHGYAPRLYEVMARFLVGKSWTDRQDLASLLLAADPWLSSLGEPGEAWRRCSPFERDRATAAAERLIVAGWPRCVALEEGAELQVHRPLSSQILEEVKATRRLVDELVAEKAALSGGCMTSAGETHATVEVPWLRPGQLLVIKLPQQASKPAMARLRAVAEDVIRRAKEGPTCAVVEGGVTMEVLGTPLNGATADFKSAFQDIEWDTLDAQGILDVVARALGRDPVNPTAEDLVFDILCLRGDLEDALESRRWIPVEERLPDEGLTVLTWSRKVGFDGGYELSQAWASLSPGPVTHWQPLPEPPQEGS
jgi:uncharacterized protein DUF551